MCRRRWWWRPATAPWWPGFAKDFGKLMQAGLTERVPKVFGVQAEGAAAIAHAFSRFLSGEPILPAEEPAQTIADSICVGKPAAVIPAVKYVAETGGGYVTVSDPDLLRASLDLAKKTGIFAEPSAAAPLAGLRKLLAENRIGPRDRVVLIITGSGLKDPSSVLREIPEPPTIPPHLEAVSEVVRG